MKKNGNSAPIESYGLIGDCETAALVGLDGSIDWLCWPDFASEACFARLLGDEQNGRWLLAPAAKIKKTSRKYRARTLILETTFETATGVVTLIDFMPVRGTNSDVVRIVKGVRGRVRMKMELILRFGYGRVVPWVTQGPAGWQAIAGPDLAVLRTPVKLTGKDLSTVASFTVRAGQTKEFILTYGPSHLKVPRRINVKAALRETQQAWTGWAKRSSYKGSYGAIVERSLITLKALTYRPTGGIVAAVTSSLPEQIGGVRNWDYRYCWLRDATFTLLALMNGGYYKEAQRWHAWLLRAIAGSPDQVQILYGIGGERYPLEWQPDWLNGYAGSKPVRIGNAASMQTQLDVYGEILDAFFHAIHRLGKDRKQDFRMLGSLVDHLEKIWSDPDEGIWETRSGPRQFTYSKVMAWVAFDRAIRIAQKLRMKAPLDRWRRVRTAIHNQVCKHAFNKELNCFVQAYGSSELDAALLLIPLVGFLPHDDPRVRSTVLAIERRLMRDGLVMRYDTGTSEDGLPPGEGAFLPCSFWMVSNLKLMGRVKDAKAMFERVVSLGNDLGLLSEEYDTRAKRLVGNFPQAFSHIALANAAFDLEREEGSSRVHAGLDHFS
jgi:GH15 family glucan-1,4-alpha-glucosidase